MDACFAYMKSCNLVAIHASRGPGNRLSLGR